MSTEELLDIFDADMNPVEPFTVTRAQAREGGHWVKVFHCWVFRREDDPKVLFQLRGAHVRNYPGLLDVSCAGHIKSGEKISDGIRELKEEIGIDVAFPDCIALGIEKISTLDLKGHKVQELCHTFLVERPEHITDFTMQPEEVDGLFELPMSGCFKLFSGEVDEIEGFGILRGQEAPQKKTFTRADFVPHFDRYYLRVMINIERYLEGKKYLAI